MAGYCKLISGGHGPSAGHLHHLMCSQNGPVTDVLDRPLPSGSTQSSEGQTPQCNDGNERETLWEHIGGQRAGLKGWPRKAS